MSTQPISLPSAHSSHHYYNGSGDYTMTSGSYTGSSNGSFNPASYMQHFMGSPMAWRSGSFGSGGRTFTSGSPMDLLIGSINPHDTRFRPSSFESNRDSIMNALSCFDPTDAIARDYRCCGDRFLDMHELLEHFEEVHVVVDESQQANIKKPFNPKITARGMEEQQMATHAGQTFTQPTTIPQRPHAQMHIPPLSDGQQHAQYPGSFDTDGMDLEMDAQQTFPQPISSQSSPSSGAPTPPDTPVSTPLSAYPSPTLQEHKVIPNQTIQAGYSDADFSNATTPYDSPFTSQPPSPHSYHHEADPAIAFDTFSAIPQPTRSTSSLDGALGNSANLRRPQLNITLTPFASRANSLNGHPGALTALKPHIRYTPQYGMPGAPTLGDGNNSVAVGMDANFVTSGTDGSEYHSGEVSPGGGAKVESGVAPALLFSTETTPVSSPGGSRVPSPTPGSASRKTSTVTLSLKSSPVSGSNGASAKPSTSAQARAAAAAALARPTASSLLLSSKPFRCPKPNCTKSYKQANGLKYHVTHGACNFAPPKDLEHVQALLERKRRDKAAAEGVTLPEDSESSPSGSGLNSPLTPTTFPDLDSISETELRDIEREAEKRLKPFACTIGDCPRRYKNMNGLRYHYQHTGEHGAIGLGLLASGQHECLKNNQSNGGSGHNSREQSTVREGRKLKLTLGGKESKPGSRATSVGRDSKPQSPAVQSPAVLQPQAYAVTTASGVAPTYSLGNPYAAATTTATQAQVLAFQQQFMAHQQAQYAQQLALEQAGKNRIYTPQPATSSLEGALG